TVRGVRTCALPILRWRWPAPPPASVGMPVADGADIAATYGHHGVVMLDGSGRTRWRAERAGVRDVAPRFAGPLVLVPTEGGLLALARADGRVLWAVSLGDRASTPVVVGDRAVVSLWGGGV